METSVSPMAVRQRLVKTVGRTRAKKRRISSCKEWFGLSLFCDIFGGDQCVRRCCRWVEVLSLNGQDGGSFFRGMCQICDFSISTY